MPKKATQQQIITQLTHQNTTLRNHLLALNPNSKMPPVEADVRMINKTTMRHGEKGRRARAIERLKQEQKQLTELLKPQDLQNNSTSVEQPIELSQLHKMFHQEELIKSETENLSNESWAAATENDLQQQLTLSRNKAFGEKAFLKRKIVALNKQLIQQKRRFTRKYENDMQNIATTYLALNQIAIDQINLRHKQEKEQWLQESEQLKIQLDQQIQEQKNHHENSQQEMQNLDAIIMQQSANLQILEYNNAQFKIQLKETQNSHVQLLTQNEELKISIERKAYALLALQFANTDLSKVNNQLLKQTQTQQQEIEHLHTLLTQLQQTVSEHEKVITNTLIENDELRTQNSQLVEQLSAESFAHSQSKNLLHSEQMINQYLSSDLKHKKEQLNEKGTQLNKLENELISAAISMSILSDAPHLNKVPNPDEVSIKVLAQEGSFFPVFGPQRNPEANCDNQENSKTSNHNNGTPSITNTFGN